MKYSNFYKDWDYMCKRMQKTAAEEYLSLCKKRDEQKEKLKCFWIFGPIALICFIGAMYCFIQFLVSIK